MPKISSSISKKQMLRIFIGPEILHAPIVHAYSVRRGLDYPFIRNKYGDVISHSAIVVTTKNFPVLIEYMDDSHVYVTECKNFSDSKESFQQRMFLFHIDSLNSKIPINPNFPKQEITVMEVATRMCDIMGGHQFRLISHNCHMARILTLKYYGINSGDGFRHTKKHTLLGLGFKDLVRKYQRLNPPPNSHQTIMHRNYLCT